MNQNGYFRVEIKEDGVYVTLYPASGAGEKLLFSEVDWYFSKIKLDYDKISLSKALNALHEPVEIKVSSQKILPENEMARIDIMEGRQVAVGRFYPPTNGGSLMSREEIINDLIKAGVKFGADDTAIANFLENRQYCFEYELAKAMPATEGHHAKITYYFNTDPSRLPKKNEDGSVNFHDLDTISHVEAGQLLATLDPADPGKPGIDVCGNVLMPAKVEKKLLRFGKKIKQSEDGLSIYSEVNGHASLVDDRVFVADIFEVGADVDVSTGDIVYDGNVEVKGSVRTGYRIKATGDIIVHGVVEGAILEAGGQIILKRGIQGMNKGVLKANSNVIAKFIENATVDAGGYVSTDSILHSKVSAKGEINVDGKRGFITGGEIRSASRIKVKTAGSTMGTMTLLEVGADPDRIEEYRKLERELLEIPEQIENLSKMLIMYAKKIRAGETLSPDKVLYVKTATKQKELLTNRMVEIRDRLAALTAVLEENTRAHIKVHDTIYPGCKLIISNVIYFVRKEVVYSRFVKRDADIVIDAY